ncbi:septum formation initiator family protein [Microbacterium invictum]|uniref:Septum formation initiator family protein n=1 Tax=Microbacterium invictum TaxID=515415 RepID=A0ABZ0VE33_9MICO|nr:septum formation initiator family protein [Microbacterium invictum]WQB71729.1 septum formation initiator family protein [Microbacterium invictum]
MTTGSAPPSPSSTRGRRRPGGRSGGGRVDVRGWLGGIRLSGFMVIMLGLVVLAAFVLVPTVGTYLDQRQQIAALERSVELTREQIDELESERERWSDPAYITTEARERLYYVRPGEVVYLIDNDLPPEDVPREQGAVSDEVERTRTDWMSQLLRSVTEAGLATSVTDPG